MGGPLHRTNVKCEECWGEAGRWGYFLAVNCQPGQGSSKYAEPKEVLQSILLSSYYMSVRVVQIITGLVLPVR